MKIFITGIAGFVGGKLAIHLRQAGHEVGGSARKPSSKEGIQRHQFGSPVPDKLFAGCSLVIHCAWDIKAPNSTDNIEGTRLLAEAARNQGVPRQIFISSLSARDGAPTQYGAEKHLAESLFSHEGNCQILRPGLIVGEGGLFLQTYHLIRDHHWIPLIDGGHFPMPLIGIHELTLCVLKLVESPWSMNHPLRLFHRYIPTQRECLADIVRVKQWNKRFLWIPHQVLLPCLSVTELLRIQIPITRANVRAALSNRFNPEDSDLDELLGQPSDYQALIQTVSLLS